MNVEAQDSNVEVESKGRFEIAFELTPEDCRVGDKHARKLFMRQAVPQWLTTVYLAFIIYSSLIAASLISGVAKRAGLKESRLLIAALLLYACTFIAIVLWKIYIMSRYHKMATAPDGVRCGQQRIIIDDGRLICITRNRESISKLDSLGKAIALDSLILIYLDQVSYYSIPRRAFQSSEAETDFLTRLKKGDSTENGILAQKDIGDFASAMPGCEIATGIPTVDVRNTRQIAGLWQGLMANLQNGIKLAFFRKVEADKLESSAEAFAVLAIFDLLLHTLLSIAETGPNGSFVFYTLGYAVMHIPIMLLAGLSLSKIVRQRELALVLPVAYLSIGIPIDLLAALFRAYLVNDKSGEWTAYLLNEDFYALFPWWVLASLAATVKMINFEGKRHNGALAVFSILLVLPLWDNPRGALWVGNYEERENDAGNAAGEEAFYLQPSLLKRALERLKPERKGVDDLYFISFAPYGSQDVFLKETEAIEKMFRERFDAAGRSILLINNPKTAMQYPFATATALEQALTRVGKVMNKDEDILFLYLTSHGSDDHHLSVDLWPYEFREIDVPLLKQMLDKSGIKWKVVVVSACYSGGFIEPLKDQRTMIMTASDAEHNSFGCGNDEDFTWFAKALFDEELRGTHSFAKAFKKASASIRTREINEKEEPSNPQIFIGEEIRPRLKQLEERLDKMK